MSRVLSDDEVQALLRGVADGAIPAGADPAAQGASVRTVDLTRRERSLRGELPGLELMADRLARSLHTSVGLFFGRLPQVSVVGLELVRFATLCGRLPEQVSLHRFRMAPLGGRGLVVVTPELVATLLEVFFGGRPGRATPLGRRTFSAIEQRVLERLAARVLLDLDAAWRPLGTLECTLLGSETSPVLATVAAPDDLLVVIELRVALDDGGGGGLALAVPDAALDPIRERLGTAVASEGGGVPAWGEQWHAALGGIELEVVAELGTHALRLGDVLRLRVGDVIALQSGRGGSALVRVEGRPYFRAEPGLAGASRAVRVTARL